MLAGPSFAFSITAEDSAVVEAALKPGAGQHIVSICSAGDTALNLLTHDVAQVTVVDRNPAQIFLAQLKAIGAAHLDIAQYRNLLGATGSERPYGQHYKEVAPHLPQDAREFWDGHQGLLRRGVLWQGHVQQLFRAMRIVLRAALGRKGLEALRAISTSADAARFVETYLQSVRTRLAAQIVFSRPFFRLFYPEQGFKYLPPGQTPRAFALQRIEDALRRTPIAGNPYLNAFLFGMYPDLEEAPPYLRKGGHALARSRISRIRWSHGDILDVLSGLDKKTVDGFDLCNVVDWMDGEAFIHLLKLATEVARPGGRILIFSRSRAITIPPELASRCHIEHEMSARLGRAERTGYYAAVNALTVQ
ncbi:MAG: BtaA family protein [Xanthobacteraceae bacterium]|nr:BtaA family protein [Xanthobacteraceae bacterium]